MGGKALRQLGSDFGSRRVVFAALFQSLNTFLQMVKGVRHRFDRGKLWRNRARRSDHNAALALCGSFFFFLNRFPQFRNGSWHKLSFRWTTDYIRQEDRREYRLKASLGPSRA